MPPEGTVKQNHRHAHSAAPPCGPSSMMQRPQKRELIGNGLSLHPAHEAARGFVPSLASPSPPDAPCRRDRDDVGGLNLSPKSRTSMSRIGSLKQRPQ